MLGKQTKWDRAKKDFDEGQEMLRQSLKKDIQQNSLMLSESETEEELLFESKVFQLHGVHFLFY